jgi:hypothetical protein
MFIKIKVFVICGIMNIDTFSVAPSTINDNVTNVGQKYRRYYKLLKICATCRLDGTKT